MLLYMKFKNEWETWITRRKRKRIQPAKPSTKFVKEDDALAFL